MAGAGRETGNGRANPGLLPYDETWEGTHYDEKEVTVYFKKEEGKIILLTVLARYGSDVPRKGN